jgi:hypothetical protein
MSMTAYKKDIAQTLIYKRKSRQKNNTTLEIRNQIMPDSMPYLVVGIAIQFLSSFALSQHSCRWLLKSFIVITYPWTVSKMVSGHRIRYFRSFEQISERDVLNGVSLDQQIWK